MWNLTKTDNVNPYWSNLNNNNNIRRPGQGQKRDMDVVKLAENGESYRGSGGRDDDEPLNKMMNLMHVTDSDQPGKFQLNEGTVEYSFAPTNNFGPSGSGTLVMNSGSFTDGGSKPQGNTNGLTSNLAAPSDYNNTGSAENLLQAIGELNVHDHNDKSTQEKTTLGMVESYNYRPALTANENPFYYDENMVHFAYYCERVQRHGLTSPYLTQSASQYSSQ